MRNKDNITVINTADFTDPSIVITCETTDAKEIASILNLELNSKRFKAITDSIYEVRPIPKRKRYPFLNLKNKRSIRYRFLKDFDSSKLFYAKFKKSSGVKIIHDEYSFIRSKLLFELVNLWEVDLRVRAAKEMGSAQALNTSVKDFLKGRESRVYRTSEHNHRLACMDINELLEYISTTEDSTSIRGMSDESAKALNKVRNASFHFRVVTPDDYHQIFLKILMFQTGRNLEAMRQFLGEKG